jgi:uncharacterized membrane protein
MNYTLLIWFACMVANVFSIRYLNKKYISPPLGWCIIMTLIGPISLVLMIVILVVPYTKPTLNKMYAISEDQTDNYDDDIV